MKSYLVLCPKQTNCMMNYTTLLKNMHMAVIDIHAFKNNDKKYIIKEIERSKKSINLKCG